MDLDEMIVKMMVAEGKYFKSTKPVRCQQGMKDQKMWKYYMTDENGEVDYFYSDTRLKRDLVLKYLKPLNSK